MAHPRKSNDSQTKHRYATQSVPTNERTTAGESDPSIKHSRGFKERAREWIHTKIPVVAPRSRNDSQPANHCASTSPKRLPIDNPTGAGGSYSAGGHSSSNMQNQPAQFMMPSASPSQTSDDTPRHPVSISYPSAGSHASGVITHPEGVERSPVIKKITASNAVPESTVVVNRDDTPRHPVSISYPSAGSHASGVITHPEGVERSPVIRKVTASNAVPESKVDATPNIIVFGESGVGKSSLINMITGTDSAATSNEAVGCTFQSASYDAELKGRKYRLWDTIGLNEGERGTASPERSIQDLQSLVLNLQHEGVNLLVYCIRGSRIRDIIKINYDLFWKIICNEQVPIVVVVTGLENEEDMEEWWTNNRPDFAARDMRFLDHGCVTTTKGKRMKNGEFMYAAEFELSIQLVRDLIVKRCPETPWKPDGSRWLIDIVQTMKQMFLQYESQSHGEGYGSHRSQARNTPAMPDSLRQFVANMTTAFDRP